MLNGLNEFAQEVHQVSVDHGWYDNPPSTPERLMLMVSELSEALEEYRNRKPNQYVVRTEPFIARDGYADVMCEEISQWNPNEKPEGIGVELADCVIRILDFCAAERIDIESLVNIKNEYNKNRPFKHGGKRI